MSEARSESVRELGEEDISAAFMAATPAIHQAICNGIGVGRGSWFLDNVRTYDLDSIAMMIDALMLSRYVMTTPITDQEWERIQAQGTWEAEDRLRIRRVPKQDWRIVDRADGQIGVAAYMADRGYFYLSVDPQNPPQDMFEPGELVMGWKLRPYRPRTVG